MSSFIQTPLNPLLGNAAHAGPSFISQEIARQPAHMHHKLAAFHAADRPHALLITNHGYPGPDIRWPSGGPDSGGQITYVNQVAKNLVPLGYKVTVATRSFAPEGDNAKYGDRRGVDFFEDEPLARYVFVPGIEEGFVGKEQIFAELPVIAHNLSHFIDEEAHAQGRTPWDHIAWINSHYWDGGVVGQLVVRGWQEMMLGAWLADKLGVDMDAPLDHQAARNIMIGLAKYVGGGDPVLNELLERINRHAWTSHSLGSLKQENMDALPPFGDSEPNKKLKAKVRKWQYMAMNFPMREQAERALVGDPSLVAGFMLYPNVPPARMLAYTSLEILDHTKGLGAPDETPLVRFPPGTDFNVYYPRKSVKDDDVELLFAYMEGDRSRFKDEDPPIVRTVPAEIVERMREHPDSLNVIVEASRMDETKRKELLVDVMPSLTPDTILLITGMRDGDSGVYDSIRKRIDELGLENRVFLLGRVPDECMGPLCSLPHGTGGDQFRVAIGASASRMEGWGMSVMDMTAGGMPLVASDRVPYARHIDGKGDTVRIVEMRAGEVQAYAHVFRTLISDPKEAKELGMRGRAAAKEFDWPDLTKMFLNEIEGKLTRLRG